MNGNSIHRFVTILVLPVNLYVGTKVTIVMVVYTIILTHWVYHNDMARIPLDCQDANVLHISLYGDRCLSYHVLDMNQTMC